MNCQNCGAEVGDKRFCPQCGAQVQTAPAATPAAAPAQPASQGNYTQVLVFGILGLALGASTGIVGLIFSILGIRKANEYIATYGDISTQVRIGKRLAIAGLIVSIVMIVLYILLFVLGIFIGLHAATTEGHDSFVSVVSRLDELERAFN